MGGAQNFAAMQQQQPNHYQQQPQMQQQQMQQQQMQQQQMQQQQMQMHQQQMQQMQRQQPQPQMGNQRQGPQPSQQPAFGANDPAAAAHLVAEVHRAYTGGATEQQLHAIASAVAVFTGVEMPGG